MTTVAEVLEPNQLVISPFTSIMEVAQKMRDCGVDLAAVCEKDKFRGIITEKAIVSGIVASAQNPQEAFARSVMITDTPKVSLGASLFEAAKIMAHHKIPYLPVVQNGKFFGILTLEDVARESMASAAMVLSHCSHDKSPAREILIKS
ncbi:MAG: CBS domain-containing protein [Dehalococcoidia bacterium]|nr:CBS domain-containing protein [Dehalococcoidia bacterium]